MTHFDPSDPGKLRLKIRLPVKNVDFNKFSQSKESVTDYFCLQRMKMKFNIFLPPIIILLQGNFQPNATSSLELITHFNCT